MGWEKVLEFLDDELAYIHALIMNQGHPEEVLKLVQAMDTVFGLKRKAEFIMEMKE